MIEGVSESSADHVDLKPVLLFFFLAYAISWISALLLHLIARQAGLPHFGSLMGMAESTFDLGSVADQLILPVPIVFVLTRIVDFGPTLAGVTAAVIVGGFSGLRHLFSQLIRWRVGWRWYALVLFGPALLMALALGLYTLADSGYLASMNLSWPGTVQALLLWLAMRTLLGGGMGEELGWRGFALPRLQAVYGPNQASFIFGLVWTFWHLPGHLIGSSPVANIIAQLVVTVPMSYVATWLYGRTGASVLILTIFHGSFNGWNAFFERSLFPALRNADGWLLIVLIFLVGLGVCAASAMRSESEPSSAGPTASRHERDAKR